MPQPHLFVIGAHRSGTTAMVRALTELGAWPGHDLDQNAEPRALIEANMEILSECGGRWDHPEVVDDLLADPELRRRYAPVVEQALARLERKAKPNRHGLLVLKDPRLSFTLPLWFEARPEAHVLHIHRHGVDVAASLRSRHRKALTTPHRLPRLPRPHVFGGRPVSPRCATIEGAFGLWESYVTRAHDQVRALGARAQECAFEDFATDPAQVLETIVHDFLGGTGFTPAAAKLDSAASMLDASRALAFREDPELAAFADGVADRLAAARPTS